MKTQIFEKAKFSVKKRLQHFFSRIIEHDKPRETVYKGPKAILTITVEFIGAFFQDLRGC